MVIDLEATCDDGKLVPRSAMEIIEIGAVRVDGVSFEPLAEFQTFIRPVRLRHLGLPLVGTHHRGIDAAATSRGSSRAARG